MSCKSEPHACQFSVSVSAGPKKSLNIEKTCQVRARGRSVLTSQIHGSRYDSAATQNAAPVDYLARKRPREVDSPEVVRAVPSKPKAPAVKVVTRPVPARQPSKPAPAPQRAASPLPLLFADVRRRSAYRAHSAAACASHRPQAVRSYSPSTADAHSASVTMVPWVTTGVTGVTTAEVLSQMTLADFEMLMREHVAEHVSLTEEELNSITKVVSRAYDKLAAT